MIKLVYVDTSVIGGVFDSEFELWTNLFFDKVKGKEFSVAISELLIEELRPAPDKVRRFIDTLPEKQIDIARYGDEARELADKYQQEGIVGPTSLADCRHIATATVNNIRILASWNFKHIVNLNKIQLYNAVNIKEGYIPLEIRTPRELIDYED